jgi:uncharacterized membrane protein
MDANEKRTWLKAEVEGWKKKELISESQARAILSLYGLAESPEKPATGEDKQWGSITVVSVLGALLVGIGVILFVASNWNRIPDALRFMLLFGTTFATYFAGWQLKFERPSYPKIGHAMLFLASLLVGVTIFLTAQIFHVNADAYWIVLLWFFAIAPFGYALDSKPILGLNIFTFSLWMVLYVTGTRGLFMSTFETFMLYLLFGISLYGLGQLHSKFDTYVHFRIIYQSVGLFFILASYYYFSLETPYREILGEIATTDWTVQMLFVLFGITALISVIGSALSNKFQTVKHEFILLLLAFLGWIGIWLLTFFSEALTISTTRYGHTYTTLSPTVVTILFAAFTVMLFILSLGSILVGYHNSVVPFINLGMAFFALGIIHLYFTTVYELLPRSLAFIVGGLILLCGGWYLEKKRRLLITDMEAQNHG